MCDFRANHSVFPSSPSGERCVLFNSKSLNTASSPAMSMEGMVSMTFEMVQFCFILEYFKVVYSFTSRRFLADKENLSEIVVEMFRKEIDPSTSTELIGDARLINRHGKRYCSGYLALGNPFACGGGGVSGFCDQT